MFEFIVQNKIKLDYLIKKKRMNQAYIQCNGITQSTRKNNIKTSKLVKSSSKVIKNSAKLYMY